MLTKKKTSKPILERDWILGVHALIALVVDHFLQLFRIVFGSTSITLSLFGNMRYQVEIKVEQMCCIRLNQGPWQSGK